MQFEKGVFQQFRATHRIHVGNVGPTGGETVNEGAVIEYDGTTVRLNGHQGDVPHLKSAIEKGFFVVVGGSQDVVSAKPTPTQNKFKMAQDVSQDDRPVGRVVKAADRSNPTPPPTQVKEGITLKNTEFKRGDAAVLNAEASEGQVVGRLRTAAVQTTKLTSENIGQIDRQIHNLQSPTGVGARIVDKVASLTTEGVEVVEEEEPLVIPEPEVDPLQQKLAVIRLAIPGFEWDLQAHWKSRVKTALTKHVKDPLTILAILSIEADSVKKEILEGIAARQSV